MEFQKASELTPVPVTQHRDATCVTHGPYREMGGFFPSRPSAIRWFGCAKCNKAERDRAEVELIAAEEVKRQKRMEDKLDAAGIPAAFLGRSFDNFVIESAEMRYAHDIAKAFADDFWLKASREGLFLVFGGVTGTGKSHLALAVAQAVLRRGTAMYMDAAELIRRVRATWRRDSPQSEESIMALLSRLDLLVIDEVGVQRGTDDEKATLTDIINRRYSEMRPTILLTNLPGEDLVSLLGPRVMSRLSERATFVAFKWGDWRTKGGKK